MDIFYCTNDSAVACVQINAIEYTWKIICNCLCNQLLLITTDFIEIMFIILQFRGVEIKCMELNAFYLT